MNHLLISKIVDLHDSILDFTYESQIFRLMELYKSIYGYSSAPYDTELRQFSRVYWPQ